MGKVKLTKEQIVINSINVFREKGYHHTSISDLSKANNIFKSGFYYHFKDKEELMTATLKWGLEYHQKNIIPIAYDISISPKDRLIKMGREATKIFTYKNYGCFFGQTIIETNNEIAAFQPILKAFIDEYLHALTHLFKSKFEHQKSEALAKRLFCEIEGAIILFKLYNDVTYITNAFANYQDLL